MAIHTFNNTRLWIGSASIASKMQGAALGHGVEAQDCTVVTDDTRVSKAGLKVSTLAVNGFWDAAMESDFFAAIGGNPVPFTVSEPNKTTYLDQIAFVGEAVYADYSPFPGSVGELTAFEMNLQANKMARGNLFLDGSAKGSSGNSNGQQLGALADAQSSLILGLHVVSVSGTTPTLDVDIESDDNSGFTSAAVRASSNQFTAKGSQFIELVGPTTDDYWRIAFTISGTTPSFQIVAAMGIVN